MHEKMMTNDVSFNNTDVETDSEYFHFSVVFLIKQKKILHVLSIYKVKLSIKIYDRPVVSFTVMPFP